MLYPNVCRNCGQKVTDNGDELWLHNWSKSNNCDPDDPEGYVAHEGVDHAASPIITEGN